MEQKDYWDSASGQKEFTTPFQAAELKKYVREEAPVLDLGCGYGRTLDELYQTGYRNLIGMDFSEGMIARGRALYPYLDLRVKETDSIPLPDQSAEAVILFAVLTCIRENDKQRELIAEIGRVLKPGGVLYVNDFLLNSDDRNTDRYQRFQNKYGVYGVFELPEGAVCRHHDEAWIYQLLSDFFTLKYQRLIFTTMNGHESKGFYYIGRKSCQRP